MIKDETIEKVKDICDIKDIVGSFISLKRSGSGYQACCPFHHEKTASFHVNPARQIFKCFGCGKGGDSIAFVMEMQNLGFIQAIEWLAEFYKVDLEYEETGLSAEELKKRKTKERLYSEVLQISHGYFQSNLMNSPKVSEVWKYLKSRKHDAQGCMDFEIGYSPDSWDGLTNILAEKELLVEAREIGIVKEGKGGKLYDQFRNRIMFPLFNKHHQIAGFSGRLLSGDGPKYMNSSESPVFQKTNLLLGWKTAKEAIREEGFVYLVEGNFDVSTLYLYGIRNVVAPCGTSLTVSQLKQLKSVTQSIVLVSDPDAAGEKSTLRSIDLALCSGLQPDVITLPAPLDPADWVLQNLKEAKT